LRIPTRAALLPVPGVIEGAAVAAAWEGEGEATPHQSSRAMLEAQLAPRVSTLTGLGFFASASITAYTAAGSFHRWLHATYGAARFRRLYASGDFASTYGRSLAQLERDWHTFLRTVPVSERSLVRARTRFRRASVFGRRCPYTLEDLGERAHRALDAGDVAGATRAFHTLRERDPTDLRVRVQLAVAYVRVGDLAAADGVAREAAQALGPAAGNRVRTSIADAVWRWRGPTEATARYNALDLTLLEEDEARTLTLKRRALAAGGVLGEAMRDLLIGRGALDPSPTVAAARLGALLDDPVARYLAGRQYFLHERFDDTLATLDETRVAAANDARMMAETRRMIATARYLRGDLVGARAAFYPLAHDAERPQGLRDVAYDWIDRIDRELRP
jgi:hypothetical protein